MPALAPSTSLPLFAERVLADPYPAYDALRRTGAAVHLDEYGVWAVARHADIAAVLKAPEIFGSENGIALTALANQDVLAESVFASDGARHSRLRDVLAPHLALRTMRTLVTRIADRADGLVATYTQPGRFDAVALARHMVCDTVMELMGLPSGDRDVLLAGSAAVFDAFGPYGTRYQQALPLASRMAQVLRDTLTRETAEPGSWISAVFAAVDAGRIDEADAIPLVCAYTVAALDTTVLGLADCIVQLARHPRQWQILRGDPLRWSVPAFHEALRLEAPIQGYGRLLTRAADIGGVRLDEGEQVWLLYGSAGRDPHRWGDAADEYNIRRYRNNEHLAFGGGSHLCAGIPLAELQARAVLRALAARCTHLTLDGEPARALNNLLRGYREAWIAVELSPHTCARDTGSSQACRQGAAS
ncbi:cytochrome P450 [Streptomyces rubradiris]|uniref:Cytochrome P450 n=1 Tax=Streptomyces rubradiris TaxID=285531 RepID=A0ABQ3RA75_STRRR|nr:cytochrome P450 [Streptomyces rubradiris]GHH25790.1 cytochrome P450 [Streptomyces rubradiris]GHI52737.1 cytochrome P450 [Streptomyces rubradiris]